MDFNHKKAGRQEEEGNAGENRRDISGRGSLVESAVDEFAKNGGFDDLPGKGKPLKIEQGDVLTSVMRNANYQPPWIELRKEIAADIKLLADQKQAGHIQDLETGLEGVNQKIRKFNRIVPNPLLQKGLISIENVHTAYEKWV
ncbi:DUF1992 domain-containing protein [Paenibacillus donghaensis]|uniref:DnaJ family domain-containing protein n=1 Tax=Paenibacillus donghaensis TaxID=414771 RepID=UPI001883A9D9|nr:DUF1992 domain-containing protein [Paenibacillus donghaensis]MBE9915268.1 DUF1992 domain-containing protein [Paenibacillus donghaensis]